MMEQIYINAIITMITKKLLKIIALIYAAANLYKNTALT